MTLQRYVLAAVLVLMIALSTGLFVVGCRAAPAADPHKLTDADLDLLLGTDAQLQLIQRKYQDEAKPISDRQQQAIARICKIAGLVQGVDCVIDVQAKSVKKRDPVKPSTPLPEAKKK